VNLYYYKYTVDGINVFAVSILYQTINRSLNLLFFNADIQKYVLSFYVVLHKCLNVSYAQQGCIYLIKNTVIL